MSAPRSNVSTTAPKKTKGRTDVFGLILGILLTTLAGCALWVAFGGSLSTQWLKVGAPLYLVAIGVIGLVLSRNSQ